MQEYHNRIKLIAPEKDRLAFVADAFRLSRQHGWDWVKIDFNTQASRGADAGESGLDFYTRGFPAGLEELMELHPDALLDCEFMDISYPLLRRMKLQNNTVLEESEEAVEWE